MFGSSVITVAPIEFVVSRSAFVMRAPNVMPPMSRMPWTSRRMSGGGGLEGTDEKVWSSVAAS
ncbi:hypothetical protein BDM02DRAFT_3176476 [Thelephora ganbajun]|uniref:Uncharacterized protein n=1 Tax=Thelephora ganbajun TaxID=370292 RepID=A0ACB6YZP1_THEGA|nr:hypothetical protein BDM02DRAFT_3176476 [Thelephora ganbajun]